MTILDIEATTSVQVAAVSGIVAAVSGLGSQKREGTHLAPDKDISVRAGTFGHCNIQCKHRGS